MILYFYWSNQCIFHVFYMTCMIWYWCPCKCILLSLMICNSYMGAWRTWRRPPTSSLLLDWSCKRTRRRRRSLPGVCLRRVHLIWHKNTVSVLVSTSNKLFRKGSHCVWLRTRTFIFKNDGWEQRILIL